MESSSTSAPPVLSSSSEPIPAVASPESSTLSEDQLYTQYEIQRTIQEIRDGRWKRIALQFPDEMLVDAPRVFERLRDGLDQERLANGRKNEITGRLHEVSLDDSEEKLTILADTSYGACCVDEVAAEHVDAEIVVHYGRACLSPTARLPVIYVFTPRFLDMDATVANFKTTYTDYSEKVCLMADIPYSHLIPELYNRLRDGGHENVFATEVIHNPSSPIPNRTVPPDVQAGGGAEKLKEYSIFHISDPPTSLLLVLSSRVKRINILPTSANTASSSSASLPEATTIPLLRRRYALLTRIPAMPIIGILINTLSVSNYMAALQHCQDLIAAAGKKYYVFVVGKVNAAKIANFAEIGAWVVIGCWESSLVESKDFMAPIVTPFELEVALEGDAVRRWGGEWVADFAEVIRRERKGVGGSGKAVGLVGEDSGGSWEDRESDDEPPDFDLRTGRYVSRSRPMGRPKPAPAAHDPESLETGNGETAPAAPPSSALVQRAKGDVATINGTVSPAAEFLRSKRTWQGLGSDYEVAYERDEDGRIRGAAMEEGRSGVAKGYSVGEEEVRS